MEQNIIKEDIKYGISIKYKDFANMFHIDYKVAGSRKRQIEKLSRIYEIIVKNTLYTVLENMTKKKKSYVKQSQLHQILKY